LAFPGRCCPSLGYFLAQLVDLATVRVVEVLHALLTVGPFTLDVGSGCFALGGQRCDAAAQICGQFIGFGLSLLPVGCGSRAILGEL